MSDTKTPYSDASSDFVEKDAVEQEEAKRLYEKSKVREAKHNDEWKKHPVNINDVVDKYAPGAKGGDVIMRIDLFKSFEGASYYGDVPEASSVPDDQVESILYGFDAD